MTSSESSYLVSATATMVGTLLGPVANDPVKLLQEVSAATREICQSAHRIELEVAVHYALIEGTDLFLRCNPLPHTAEHTRQYTADRLIEAVQEVSARLASDPLAGAHVMQPEARAVSAQTGQPPGLELLRSDWQHAAAGRLTAMSGLGAGDAETVRNLLGQAVAGPDWCDACSVYFAWAVQCTDGLAARVFPAAAAAVSGDAAALAATLAAAAGERAAALEAQQQQVSSQTDQLAVGEANVRHIRRQAGMLSDIAAAMAEETDVSVDVVRTLQTRLADIALGGAALERILAGIFANAADLKAAGKKLPVDTDSDRDTRVRFNGAFNKGNLERAEIVMREAIARHRQVDPAGPAEQTRPADPARPENGARADRAGPAPVSTQSRIVTMLEIRALISGIFMDSKRAIKFRREALEHVADDDPLARTRLLVRIADVSLQDFETTNDPDALAFAIEMLCAARDASSGSGSSPERAGTMARLAYALIVHVETLTGTDTTTAAEALKTATQAAAAAFDVLSTVENPVALAIACIAHARLLLRRRDTLDTGDLEVLSANTEVALSELDPIRHRMETIRLNAAVSEVIAACHCAPGAGTSATGNFDGPLAGILLATGVAHSTRIDALIDALPDKQFPLSIASLQHTQARLLTAMASRAALEDATGYGKQAAVLLNTAAQTFSVGHFQREAGLALRDLGALNLSVATGRGRTWMPRLGAAVQAFARSEERLSASSAHADRAAMAAMQRAARARLAVTTGDAQELAGIAAVVSNQVDEARHASDTAALERGQWELATLRIELGLLTEDPALLGDNIATLRDFVGAENAGRARECWYDCRHVLAEAALYLGRTAGKNDLLSEARTHFRILLDEALKRGELRLREELEGRIAALEEAGDANNQVSAGATG